MESIYQEGPSKALAGNARDNTEVEILRDRLSKLNARLNELKHIVRRAADTLYGPKPPEEKSSGEVSNAQPSIAEAIDWLDIRIDALFDEARRF